MTEFKRTRPLNDVRLTKKWPPARVSQLKLMLSHLESAVNNGLAAQVAQNPSREFSEFVPKIVSQNIISERSYREIRIIFKTPRGLRRFLFYEMDVARNNQFNDFDRFNSPETAFTFTALEPGVTFFFRLRVVTTDGEVGPWSDTFSVTALRARGSSVFDNRNTLKIFGPDSTNEFQTLFTATHPAVGGNLFYMINYEIRPLGGQDADHNLSWSDIEFRWLENGNQISPEFGSTIYGVKDRGTASLDDNITVTTADIGGFTLGGPFDTKRRGTFSQKLHSVSEGNISIVLQARQINPHPTSKDWTENLASTTVAQFQDGYFIQLRNFSSFEYILDA